MKTVYYGPVAEHYALLSWSKLEPLSSSLKSHLRGNGRSSIMGCPSFMQDLKNTYVIKSPFDIEISASLDETVPPSAIITSGIFSDNINSPTLSDPNIDGLFLTDLVQFLSDGFYLFFADGSINMSIMPPYLHHNKIYGVSGSFDIGQWFRCVSFATYVDQPTVIKTGEPLAYISFPEKVKLKPILWPEYMAARNNYCTSFKGAHSGASLRQQYEAFMRLPLRKKILKEAKGAVPID